MAGTMPHAIFVETGLDDGATVAAYAAAAEAGEFGGDGRRAQREVFSTAARPNIIAAGSRRRPPRRRRP